MSSALSVVTFAAAPRYSLLQAVCAHGHALVELRNPWGGCEWTGAWSARAPEWDKHPEARQEHGEREASPHLFFVSSSLFSFYAEVAADLHHSSDNDGRFWMPFSDFEAWNTELQARRRRANGSMQTHRSAKRHLASEGRAVFWTGLPGDAPGAAELAAGPRRGFAAS